jgi:NAD(P)-dependent dehydrogenase (short-subunit alcohol dehydrogenase family)
MVRYRRKPRGLGAEIVRPAVRGGDQVIAAARNPTAVTDNLVRNSDRLLSVELIWEPRTSH